MPRLKVDPIVKVVNSYKFTGDRRERFLRLAQMLKKANDPDQPDKFRTRELANWNALRAEFREAGIEEALRSALAVPVKKPRKRTAGTLSLQAAAG